MILSVGEEVVRPEEVKKLLERKENPICYDGFEPSGRMHIAQVLFQKLARYKFLEKIEIKKFFKNLQGIMKCINVNKLTEAGCIFVFWVADWFALLNNKMGGRPLKLRKIVYV